MKLALAVAALVGVGTWIARARQRDWEPPIQFVSKAWTAAQDVREDRKGVDLPRWRTPKERVEMRRQALRLAHRKEKAG